MTDQPANYARRALEHAANLTNLYPRGSATPGEGRAAEYVRKQLSLLGAGAVQVQTFAGLRSLWLFAALAFGSALAGHAAFWLLRRPLGGAAAWVLSALLLGWSAFLLWRRFSFRSTPLIQSLPHGPSQNVFAVLPPAGQPQRKVVLLAHLDSHRAVWVFATDLLARLYGLLAPLSLYGVPAAAALYLLSLVDGLGFLAWLALPLALLHFAAWFTGMTADLGPYSPGANDNASAAGSLLAAAERIQRQPLAHTETWLVFTGCEETGCDGLQAFLGRFGSELQDALWLDLELVGIGECLAYLGSEGLLPRRRISGEVETLLRAAAPAGLARLDLPAGAFTEMGLVWARGGRGACLTAQPAAGPALPEWHRLSDRPEKLQENALQQTHDLLWSLLQRYDQDGL